MIHKIYNTACQLISTSALDTSKYKIRPQSAPTQTNQKTITPKFIAPLDVKRRPQSAHQKINELRQKLEQQKANKQRLIEFLESKFSRSNSQSSIISTKLQTNSSLLSSASNNQNVNNTQYMRPSTVLPTGNKFNGYLGF